MPVMPLREEQDLRPHIIPEFEVRPSFLMIDPARALSCGLSSPRRLSWEILRACIEISGGEVRALPPSSEAASSETFVQDPFVVIPALNIAIGSLASAFNAESRRNFPAEQAYLGSELLREGYRLLTITERVEGGNILYHAPSKTLFQGRFAADGLGGEGSRTALERVLQTVDPEITVMTVPIIRSSDYRYVFHLDQCMSILPYGEVLIDSVLVSPETLENISAKVGQENLIPNNKLEKGHNIVTVGPTLLTEKMDFRLQGFLETKGYRVITPLSLVQDYEGKNFELMWERLEKNGAVEAFLRNPYVVCYDIEWCDQQTIPQDAATLKGEIANSLFLCQWDDPNAGVHLGRVHDGGPHCISLQVRLGQVANPAPAPANKPEYNRDRPRF